LDPEAADPAPTAGARHPGLPADTRSGNEADEPDEAPAAAQPSGAVGPEQAAGQVSPDQTAADAVASAGTPGPDDRHADGAGDASGPHTGTPPAQKTPEAPEAPAVHSPGGEAEPGPAGGGEGDRTDTDSGRGAASGAPRSTGWAAAGDDAALSDPDRLRAAVEGVLLVVDTPTSATSLAQGLAVPVAAVERVLRELRAEYDSQRRGIDLREIAGGWRLYTREELAPYVERFMLEGQQAKLTQAALETLAVVAYRQPVTRSRVSAIRGVNVDGVMRTLSSRGLIEECGADPETGGSLYRTTAFFLEKMGLTSLAELPSLAPLLPDTSQLDDVGLST
jgi:segregation and condensation protein B